MLTIPAFGALGIISRPATNVTTVSATFQGSVTGTNASSPSIVLWYGTVDYSNNAALWGSSNVYGTAGTGAISTNITGLLPLHRYYFNWLASDGVSNIWATTGASSNFWTHPLSPTSTPTAASIYLALDPVTHLILAPLDFAVANGISGWLTNETGSIFTNWLATNTYVKTESDLVHTNWLATNTYVKVETDPIATGQVAALSNQVQGITNGAALGVTAVQPAATNGWEVGSHASLLTTNGSGAGLTNITAAQVGAVATNGNAVGLTNFPISVVLTNNLKLLAAITNVVINNVTGTVANAIANVTIPIGITSHTNLVDQNGDTNFLHITAAEKIVATNILSVTDGTNTTIRAIGANSFAVDMAIGTNGIMFAADTKLMMTTNNTLGIWYFITGAWSNAFEVTK